MNRLICGGEWVGAEIGNIDNFYILRMRSGVIEKEDLRERKRSLENAIRIIKESRKRFEKEMKKAGYEI